MNLSDDLTWRGLIKDKTFDDVEWLNKPRTFYHGVDASSNSMTIGNLAAMLLARRFMDAGWKAVLLAGGATSLVGDPGGKAEERDLKPREEIQKNVEAIKGQIRRLFAGKDFTLVDNYAWFKSVGYLEFLRDIGKHYSMTELMQRDFVKERMSEDGSGISYAEFSYSLIQGYDFWKLFKDHGVVLQIGGSDQWGNMLSGVPLIRKKEGAEVHALSMPLVVNKATGIKFGKSEEGAVWLDPAKTNPTQFFQFWVNISDEDVEDYLKMFTLVSKEDIESIMNGHRNSPSERLAQIWLAQELTALIHGKEKMTWAETVTDYLIGKSPIGEASSVLADLRSNMKNAKSATNGSIIDALVTSELAVSNTDARRLLKSGAVYINGQSVNRENFEESDFQNGRLLLRRGKAYKDSALVELE